MITGSSLRQTNRNLQKSLERLSTGLRINRAADDAAGLSVSEQLRTQVRGLNMGARNIQDGIALLNIAEGALNEVEAMLQRMRELSIQAANDTLTTKERSYIQLEIDQLVNEINRITAGTQYNSQPLLNGTEPWGDGGGVLHIGPNNDDDADVIQFQIDPVDSVSLRVDTIGVENVEDATDAIDTLDDALDSVNRLRATLGAMTNRLEHSLINQENQETNMQAAESVIRDSDYALETSIFVRNQILEQSTVAMLAQANSAPQSILSLLQ
jgi:flagellin